MGQVTPSKSSNEAHSPFYIIYRNKKCNLFSAPYCSYHHYYGESKKIYDIAPENSVIFQQLLWHKNQDIIESNINNLKESGFNLNNIYNPCDTIEELEMMNRYGYKNTFLSTSNIVVNEDIFYITEDEKCFDSLMVTRFMPYKRTHLASEVKNMALCASNFLGGDDESIEYSKTIIPKLDLSYYAMGLDANILRGIYNKSMCTLMLSEVEGPSFATVESLLCGVPVVTTYNMGGRDFFLNDENSIHCDPSPTKIAEAVKEFNRLWLSGQINRIKIRNDCLKILDDHRQNLFDIFRTIEKDRDIIIPDGVFSNRDILVKMYKNLVWDNEILQLLKDMPR